MPTLRDIVKRHLDATGMSVRALASEAGLGYQIVLGVVNRGSVPRKAEHREALRGILAIDEDEWGHILMTSATEGLDAAGENQKTLQQLVSRAMYAKGLTEQELAKVAGVAYSTVMGITRKGAIPRTDSLRRLTKALGLDQESVKTAAALSRTARRNPEVTNRHEKKARDERSLAQHIADLIQSRQQSVGAFARDVGVGYLTMSSFLDGGLPPDDEHILIALRRTLDLSNEDFDNLVERSRKDPVPARFAPRDDIIGTNANQLQKALVGYMRANELTLKALAKKADLSQVTVSRLVKQGQSPTRATTHLKLQELLGLKPEVYQSLTQGEDGLSLPALEGPDESAEDEDGTDSYMPQDVEQLPMEELGLDADRPPTKDELVGLVKKLGPKQREALRGFLSSLI